MPEFIDILFDPVTVKTSKTRFTYVKAQAKPYIFYGKPKEYLGDDIYVPVNQDDFDLENFDPDADDVVKTTYPNLKWQSVNSGTNDTPSENTDT